jgi:hypothetical protein
LFRSGILSSPPYALTGRGLKVKAPDEPLQELPATFEILIEVVLAVRDAERSQRRQGGRSRLLKLGLFRFESFELIEDRCRAAPRAFARSSESASISSSAEQGAGEVR